MKKDIVWIAIGLPAGKSNAAPKILGVYRNKPDAEKHYNDGAYWVNVVSCEVE